MNDSGECRCLAYHIWTPRGRKSIVLFVEKLGALMLYAVVRSELNLDHAYPAHSGEDGSGCWYRCGHVPPQKCVCATLIGCMWAHVPVATMKDWNEVFLINVEGTLLCYRPLQKQ